MSYRRRKYPPRPAAARLAALAGVLALVVSGTVFWFQPAQAGNWYGATGYYDQCGMHGNMTNDKNMSVGYVELSADYGNAMNVVRGELVNPTSIDTNGVNGQNVNSSTDVVLRDQYYTDWCENTTGVQWTTDGVYGLQGVTNCEHLVSTYRCGQHTVRISNVWFDVRSNAGDRWLVCHEFGHAIGLIHRNVAGCMQNTQGFGPRAYTPHDLAHINGSW